MANKASSVVRPGSCGRWRHSVALSTAATASRPAATSQGSANQAAKAPAIAATVKVRTPATSRSVPSPFAALALQSDQQAAAQGHGQAHGGHSGVGHQASKK